jgi:hypothetical protein
MSSWCEGPQEARISARKTTEVIFTILFSQEVKMNLADEKERSKERCGSWGNLLGGLSPSE